MPKGNEGVPLTDAQIEFLERFDEDEVIFGQMIKQGIEQQEIVLALCYECGDVLRPHIVIKSFYDFLPQEDLICMQCLLLQSERTGP